MVKQLNICAAWLGLITIMLRNRNMSFVVPQVKTHGSKSFKYNGIKVWNDLPYNIRETNIKEDFKSKCKKHLSNQMMSEANSVFTV